MAILPVLQDVDEAAAARAAITQKLRMLIRRPCRRVLIINPPQIPEADFLIDRALHNRYWNYPPYGPGVLCRNLGTRGYEADLLDLNYEVLFAAHEAHTSGTEFVYQLWKEKLWRKLEDFRPDVVGVSCMFTMTHAIMKEIVEYIKLYDRRLPVIAGGVHLSNATKLVLEDCPGIDFIGRYESDQSFPDALDVVNCLAPQDHLAQIATLINGKYVEIEARALPSENQIQILPDYKSLPIGEYYNLGQIGTYGHMRPGRPAASVLRERGCRARCSFCSVRYFNGPGVRERNYLSVIEEVERLIADYGIKHITFLDDDLLSDPRDLMLFFNEIVRRNLDITWDATNGLIAAFITEELMAAMVASGCVGFNLGIESGNDDILRQVHKPGTTDSFRKCMAIASKYQQVFVKAFLMMGFPGETLAMMGDTVNLCMELNFDWASLQVLTPLPSTEIYGVMIEQGLIQDGLQTPTTAFLNGPQGRQRLVEERQKLKADEFFDLFHTCKLDEVPPKEMLGDLWFIMDYKINYEQLLGISNPVKLAKIRTMLLDICNRIAPENPMAWLFAAIVEQKLARPASARTMIPMARRIVRGSAYWQKRFETLGLYDLTDKFDRETS